MHCPQTLFDTLSVPNPNPDRHGNLWQYHSRGDRHSKVACWGILLDLMASCPPLVEQFRSVKPAPQSGDIFHYDSMIHRLAELYRGRFS
jgi:hypothetical protein